MRFANLVLTAFYTNNMFVMAAIEDQRCRFELDFTPVVGSPRCARRATLIAAARQHCRIRNAILQSHQFIWRQDTTTKCRRPKATHINFACCERVDEPGYYYARRECIFIRYDNPFGYCYPSSSWKTIISYRESGEYWCKNTKNSGVKSPWVLANWDIGNQNCRDKSMQQLYVYSCCGLRHFTLSSTQKAQTTPKRAISTTSSTPKAQTAFTNEISPLVNVNESAVVVTDKPKYTLNPAQRAETNSLSTETTIGLILGGIFGSILIVFIAAVVIMRQKRREQRIERLLKSYAQLTEANNTNGVRSEASDLNQYDSDEVTTATTINPDNAREHYSVIVLREDPTSRPPPEMIQRTVSKKKRKSDGTVTEKVTTDRIVLDDSDIDDFTRPYKAKKPYKSQSAHSIFDDHQVGGSRSTVRSRKKQSSKRREKLDDYDSDDNNIETVKTTRTVNKRRKSTLKH